MNNNPSVIALYHNYQLFTPHTHFKKIYKIYKGIAECEISISNMSEKVSDNQTTSK